MAERTYATGRRKTSVARVWVKPGSGKIEINKQPVNEYFRRGTLELIVKQPLEHVGQIGSFDVFATVSGGDGPVRLER
jgi:small subunit ribosomal protein S9